MIKRFIEFIKRIIYGRKPIIVVQLPISMEKIALSIGQNIKDVFGKDYYNLVITNDIDNVKIDVFNPGKSTLNENEIRFLIEQCKRENEPVKQPAKVVPFKQDFYCHRGQSGGEYCPTQCQLCQRRQTILN
jgi:hypothetical protein